jgi:hypothetical protein
MNIHDHPHPIAYIATGICSVLIAPASDYLHAISGWLQFTTTVGGFVLMCYGLYKMRQEIKKDLKPEK